MYYIEHNGERVGEFELTPMPGCAVVGISHHLVIYAAFRNKGHGKRAQHERLDLARKLGFQVLLATVHANNKAQNKILETSGWKRFTTFDNPRTSNRIEMWSKNLTDPYDCCFYEGHGCR